MARGIFNKQENSSQFEVGNGLKVDSSGKIIIDDFIVATDVELANLGAVSISENNIFTGVNKFTNI